MNNISRNTEEARKWACEHPKGYKLIVEMCKSKIAEGNENIHIVDILSNLIWNNKIKASIDLCDSLTEIIIEDYPELQNSIKSSERKERPYKKNKVNQDDVTLEDLVAQTAKLTTLLSNYQLQRKGV